MKRKILITGGQGYLGGRIASFLADDANFKITVTSRSPKINTGNSKVLAIKIDTEKDDLEALLKSYDAVIHLAALDAGKSVEHPIQAIDVNITDTLRWRIAADKAGVEQFIYFSTIHVYGNQQSHVLTEESCVFPSHPYAITHVCAEQYTLCPLYSKNSKGIVFRLSNAFGFPKTEITQWHLVAMDFCKQAIEQGKITIKSNGETARDFITISNVCEVLHHFLQNNVGEGIYNLSSGVNTSLFQLATDIKNSIKNLYRKEIDIVELAIRKSVNAPIISSDKLKELGVFQKDEYYQELEDLVNYCFNNFKPL